MVKLILYQQDQKLGVELKDGVYKLGREKPADVVIPHPSVSASHAELQIEGDTYRIRDLGSRNGTTVNGKPVKAAKVVKSSDEIFLGQVRIALEGPADIKPIPSAGPGLSGPTVKMEAVKVAASRLSWAVRYWMSAAMAVLFLLVLFLVVMLYSESAASQTRMNARFKALAAQYIHVFANGTPETVPPPVVDESMRGGIL